MHTTKTNTPKKVKIFSSVPMMAGMIFMMILCYGIFLFVLLHEPAREQVVDNLWCLVIICFFTVILSNFAFFYTARRWFTVLVIKESGIETSLFHFFYKKIISWDNVTEIVYCERLSPFIFINDGESIQNLDYEEIINRKTVLQVSLTPKVYKVISHYSGKPIIGLSEEKIDLLKLNK